MGDKIKPKLPQDPQPRENKNWFQKFMSIRKVVGNVVVYLWPFVYLAVFTIGLLVYDTWFA